jgi:hypothetical protein
MEAERRIVFPETTVIAKDVYRLVTELSRNPDNTAAVGVSEIDVMDVTEIDIVDVSELE